MTAYEPRAHIWTTEEYKPLLELGVFAGKRLELIEGMVIEMSPMGKAHEVAILVALEALQAAFGRGYTVRPQMTLDFSPLSMPEPDLAVVQGSARAHLSAQPTTALLVIEVSDTTLFYDRTQKASLYAKHGIQDYWIINVNQGRLEVYRDPIEDSGARYGYHYGTILPLTRDDHIAPLALPDVSLSVRDLLP